MCTINRLRVKQSTRNTFIYGELGRTPYQMLRYFNIIKYCLKVINNSENEYVSFIYEMILRDIETNDRKTNWASLVKNLLASREHHCIKVTPDFHLTYRKNGGNLGSESK